MGKKICAGSFWILAAVLPFLLTVAADSLLSFRRDCRSLQQDVLRLHILANSDSQSDQAVKLKVRDALLAESGMIFNEAENLSDAKKSARENLQKAERIAEQILRAEGKPYHARAEIRNLFFSTRYYDRFTMPAGRYQALQITLGEGKGHNWWCVLYPPLCVGAAGEIREELRRFSPEEQKILNAEPEYEVRFYIIELAERLELWLHALRGRKAELLCCESFRAVQNQENPPEFGKCFWN